MTEIKVGKIPWIPIVIVTILMCSIGISWLYMLPWSASNWYGPGTIGCFQQFSQSAFILTILAVLLTYVEPLRKRMDIRSITYAYATGLAIANVLAQANGYGVNHFSWLLGDRLIYGNRFDYVPQFALPPAEIVRLVTIGGTPVPWAEWFPSILFWWITYSIGSIFYISIAAILRRSFVEIEKVPFPHVMILHNVITTLSRTDHRPKLSRQFLLGIALGLIFNFPLLLGQLFPWFPDIYGWRIHTCGPGAQWLTPDWPIASLAGLAMFNKNPALVAVFYLAPLSILFSAVLWHVIFVVLMQIAFGMGYYTGIIDLNGCGRVWCGTTSYRVGAPYKWFAFTSVGVATGLGIFYLILNRRYIIETIHVALGKLSKERIAEIERNEPLSYRNAYIMLLTSTVLMIILFTAYGVPIAGTITIMLVGLIFALVNTRVYGMANFVAPAGTGLSYGYLKLAVGEGFPLPPPAEWVRTFTWGHAIGQPIYTGWAWPLVSSIGSYTMASRTGVDSKAIFKIVTMVSILSLLVVGIVRVQLVHAFGSARLTGAWIPGWSFIDGFAWPTMAEPLPAHKPWEYHVLGGIVLSGLLMLLHAKFLWFPLEPIGLILATDGHALIEGIWTAFTAAWALKAITLKIGGSKLYEDVGIPIVTGFITGYLVAAFIGGLALLVKFFVPF